MTERIAHYEILEEIGRGGMGVVYRAHEPSLNRTVAIKVLGQHLAQDTEYVKRFEREAQAAAALNHPNIVQIYAIGEDDGRHYFAMEYVDGTSVQELIRREGRLAPERAADIALQAAKGLAAAHDRGLIHRDIKPANLMVTRDGLVKIADFGLALRPDDQTRITASGLLMGTPGYLAPEQCLDRTVDARTDIYALGVTLFEMLTGKAPFTADSPAALIRKIVDGETPDPGELATDLDPALRQAVLRMMAKEPSERYQTCYQVAADLTAYLRTVGSAATALPPIPPPPPKEAPVMDAGPTTPVPSRPGQPAAPPQHRTSRRTGVIVAVVLLFCLLGIAGAGYVAYRTGLIATARSFLPASLPFLGKKPAETGTAKAVPETGEPSADGVQADRGPETPPLLPPPAGMDEGTGAPVSGPSGTSPSAGGGGVARAGSSGTGPAGADGGASHATGAPAGGSRMAAGATENAGAVSSQGKGMSAAGPPPAPRPRGTAVVVLGDPLLGGAVERLIEAELRDAGVQLVDEHGDPAVETMLAGSHSGSWDATAILEELADLAGAVVLVQIEPVAERELYYLNRADTAWTADVIVSVVDPATGGTIERGCHKRVEYTTVGVQAQAGKALAGCGRRLANALWGR